MTTTEAIIKPRINWPMTRAIPKLPARELFTGDGDALAAFDEAAALVAESRRVGTRLAALPAEIRAAKQRHDAATVAAIRKGENRPASSGQVAKLANEQARLTDSRRAVDNAARTAILAFGSAAFSVLPDIRATAVEAMASKLEALDTALDVLNEIAGDVAAELGKVTLVDSWSRTPTYRPAPMAATVDGLAAIDAERKRLVLVVREGASA